MEAREIPGGEKREQIGQGRKTKGKGGHKERGEGEEKKEEGEGKEGTHGERLNKRWRSVLPQ